MKRANNEPENVEMKNAFYELTDINFRCHIRIRHEQYFGSRYEYWCTICCLSSAWYEGDRLNMFGILSNATLWEHLLGSFRYACIICVPTKHTHTHI